MTLLYSLCALAAYFVLPDQLRQLFIGRVRNALMVMYERLPAIGEWPQLVLLVVLPVVLIWLLYDLFWSISLVPLAFLLMLSVVVLVFGDSRRDPVIPELTDDQRASLANPDTMAVAAIYARKNALSVQMTELFTPLFWLFLLGPVGALAFYLLRFYASANELEVTTDADGNAHSVPSSLVALAGQLTELAGWLPARLLALSLALAGNFSATWKAIQQRIITVDNNVELVQLAAEAAEPVCLDSALTVEVALSDTVYQLQGLLNRALAVWMVFLALHTLWP